MLVHAHPLEFVEWDSPSQTAQVYIAYLFLCPGLQLTVQSRYTGIQYRYLFFLVEISKR